MDSMEHGVGFTYLSKTVAQTQQDCGWLLDVPFGIASFVIFVFFVGSLCQLGYGIKNAKVHRLIQVGTVDYLLSLTFLLFLTSLYGIAVVTYPQ